MRSNLTRVWLFAIGGLCFSSTATTLDEVLEKAFVQNLDYQIALEQLQQAQNNEQASFAGLLPNLNLASSRNEELSNNRDDQSNSSVNDASYSTQLQLSQVLYDPVVMASWKISELRTLDSELSYLRTRQQLVFNVKRVWFQLVTDQALASEAEAALLRLKQHRANAQHLYANGNIWRNDLLQADVRVARGEQALLVAQNTAKRTLTDLNILLNQNILVEIVPQQDLSDVSFDIELSQSLQTAIAERPDLQQQDLAVAIAKQNKKAAHSGYLPKVSARITHSNLADNVRLSDADRNTQFSINMNWTLWDNFSTRNQNRNAVHDIEIARKTYQRIKEQLQQETHTAWLALQEAKQNIQVLEKAVKQAEENFRVSGIRYKEQLSTANDVLDAQDLLTSTKNDLLGALGAYFIARSQLDLAMGAEE